MNAACLSRDGVLHVHTEAVQENDQITITKNTMKEIIRKYSRHSWRFKTLTW